MRPLVHRLPVLFAAVLALFLSGCILSEGPLFDTADAVTPLEPGRYEARERADDGTFKPTGKAVTLTLAGTTYTMSEEGQDPVPFTLYEEADGLFVAMAHDPDEPEAGYAPLRIEGGEIVFWAAVCEVAEDNGVLANYPQIENDGLSCTLPDKDTLVAFLGAYAATAQPDFRYVLVNRT
ncbi:hypothetical protein ACKTEK_03010 [Tepidamorphus sp. 3E244]|uniref:hypothetical protein n=1 Tax=Tepidamorphus sp. 3E244 TaxID=3385498 RepID=UPI0038FC6538